MTDHDHLFEKLDFQSKLIEDQAKRLKNIERMLTSIAVQEEKIATMNSQINALWRKYDNVFGPGGTIFEIKQSIARCPAESLRLSINRLWATFGLGLTLITLLISLLRLWS